MKINFAFAVIIASTLSCIICNASSASSNIANHKPVSKYNHKRTLLTANIKSKITITNNDRAAEFLPIATISKFYNTNTNAYSDVADTSLYIRALNGDLQQVKEFMPSNNTYYINSIANYTNGANHEVLSTESQNFNGVDLVNSFKTSFEYDNLLNTTMTTNYNWDTINHIWITNNIVFSTYNGTMLTKEILYSMDTLGINLEPVSKTTITYLNNLVSHVIMQKYTNNTWINDTQNDSIFWNSNSNETPESFITSTWDTATNTWNETEKYVATFANGVLEHENYYAYNNGWQLTGQANFTYNASNFITSIVEYSNSSLGIQTEFASSTTYNPDNTVSTDISYNYSNGVINYTYKSAYAYDDNKNQIFDSISHLDSGATQYVKDILIRTYYNSFETKLAEILPQKISIYPNPATETLNISNSQNIFSYQVNLLDGSCVYNGNTFPINIAQLANGIYFLTLTDKHKQQTNYKFIKN